MHNLILSRFAFQLDYLKHLVGDIGPDRMADQPFPGMNHPAWLLGHLVWAADLVPALLGPGSALDPSWAERFGNRTRPVADVSVYPSREDLLFELEKGHARASECVRHASPEVFGEPMPDPRYRGIMPTIGDAVVHILTTHEATHAGQLSAWRRAAGLSPTKFLSFV